MNQHRQETRLGCWVRGALLSGVALSGILLAAGISIVFLHREPRPEGTPPELGVLIRGALRGNGLSIIDLALLILMVTPLVRVMVLAVGWTMTRQVRFAAAAFVVLALLGMSFALGVR